MLTYVARSIHLHWVQNLMVTRGNGYGAVLWAEDGGAAFGVVLADAGSVDTVSAISTSAWRIDPAEDVGGLDVAETRI